MQPAFSSPSTFFRWPSRQLRFFSHTGYTLRCSLSDNTDLPRGSWDLKSSPTTASPRHRSPRNFRSQRPQQDRDQYQHRRKRWNDDDFADSSSRIRKDVGPEAQLVRNVMDSDHDLLYGINPVLYAMRARRRQIMALFIQDTIAQNINDKSMTSNRKAENDAALGEIIDTAKRIDLPIHHVSKGSLCVLARDRPHQGIILETGPLELSPLPNAPNLPNTNDVCLVLDEVTDPQNAGALIRSAHFLGASRIIVCRRHAVSITPVVSKASAGAVEVVAIDGVASMPRFLTDAQQKGWEIIGLGVEDSGELLSDVTVDKPTMVVLGSEGRGLRTAVRRTCNKIVRINGNDESIVDSLNVSVAGAIALYQLLKNK